MCIQEAKPRDAELDFYVARRAKKGSAEKKLEILRTAPACEPEAEDRL